MKTVSVKEIREIDSMAIEVLGIPGVVLMENAGREIHQVAVEMLGEPGSQKITILCGKGNNGGDGFVAGRHLLNSGYSVDIFLIGKSDEVRGDAGINMNILKRSGFPILEVREEGDISKIESSISASSLIIDALLGTGVKGSPEGVLAKIIKTINESSRPILSVDVPSGIDADTGEVLGVAVKATKTVTFVSAKKGLLLSPAMDFVGEIIVADIGIPDTAVR